MIIFHLSPLCDLIVFETAHERQFQTVFDRLLTGQIDKRMRLSDSVHGTVQSIEVKL